MLLFHLKLPACRIKSALSKSFKLQPVCKFFSFQAIVLPSLGSNQSEHRREWSPFECPEVHRVMPAWEADSFQPPCNVVWPCLLNAVGFTQFCSPISHHSSKTPLLFLEYSRNPHLWGFVFPLFGGKARSTHSYGPILLLFSHTDLSHFKTAFLSAHLLCLSLQISQQNSFYRSVLDSK